MAVQRTRGQSPIRIAIADADLLRHAECSRLTRKARHIRWVARAVRTDDVLPMVAQYRPRVLMLDPGLCDEDGVHPVWALRLRYPQTKVVLLPARAGHDERVLRALGNGACAYLTSEALHRRLCAALCGVDDGEAWVPRRMLGRMLDRSLA